jgi:N-acetylneuraminic acid mutarotase
VPPASIIARSHSAATWRSLAPATLARTEVAAARVGRFIYVMGGFEERSGATTAATERYDIERDHWTRVRDMPVALNHAAAASYRGRVYVLGGYRSRSGLDDESSALYRYDPRADRWRRLPSAPTARGALAVGVIGNRLYAAGGATGGRALTTLEIYDFDKRRWRAGPAMAHPREHLAGAVARGRFYVLAGRAAGQGNFTVVESYDPRSRRWRGEPDMAKARGGIAAATTASGRVVVVGGEESAGTIREVELLDPRTRRWRRLPDLPTPRHGLGAVARGDRVYVIEGGNRPGFAFTSTLEALTLG